MKIVVAPDSFKGSMSSTNAAQMIGEGLREAKKEIEVIPIPMADGGEGTVEAILASIGGEKVSCRVEDPLGRIVKASYGWMGDRHMAVIEMASASGLPLLADGELNPDQASTYGTGQLVHHALDQGAQTIIIGLGGSATCDGGVGFFQALGMHVLDAQGKRLERVGGGELGQIADIDLRELDERLQKVTVIVASDVTNPLLGEQGAVHIFGPQKGVGPSQIPFFESGMKQYAQIVRDVSGTDMKDRPGSGAAGGFGFSLLSFLNVKMVSGFELVAELSQLEDQIQAADLVVTGEGHIDAQSLFGKVPVAMARLSRKHNVPVVAFAGKIDGDIHVFQKEGLAVVLPIVDQPMSLEEAIEGGPELLRAASRRLMEVMRLGHLYNF